MYEKKSQIIRKVVEQARNSKIRCTLVHQYGVQKTYKSGEHPVEIYLRKIENFYKDNPIPEKPNPKLAIQCENILQELRKAVIQYGIPECKSPIESINSTIPKETTTNHTELTQRAHVWYVLIMTPLLCEKYTVGTKAIVNNNGNTIKDANFSNDPIDHSINHTNRAVLDPEKQDKNITSSNHGLNKLLVLENTYIDSKKYIKLIRMGPSPRYQLIRNDSFRTFHASSTLPSPFWDKVPEQVLVRICNSCDHHIGPTCNILYCQGMNVLAGVLLYVMPEIHAFNIYTILCSRLLPLYWKSSHIGVEAGCVLVDSLLEILDPELFHHFTSQEPKLQALIYAFPIIKTLCASIQPLQEAVLLWDFILSMGPYITVLCATAHILLIRDDLLQSQYPKHLLDPRRSSRLRSQSIVSLVMSLIPLIPQDLFDILELHTTSPKVVEHITGRAVYGTSIKEPTNN